MQAYDGLGPEVTNSRLAMLGFAAAAFWELKEGIDVFQQVDRYPLITVATFVIFTVASWIPFMQGQSYNVKSGPFTPAVSVCWLSVVRSGWLCVWRLRCVQIVPGQTVKTCQPHSSVNACASLHPLACRLLLAHVPAFS